MKIIGYVYDAAEHCPSCTRNDYIDFKLRLSPEAVAKRSTGIDQHAIPYDLIDREGNPVQPIYDIDEPGDSPESCDTCFTLIRNA